MVRFFYGFFMGFLWVLFGVSQGEVKLTIKVKMGSRVRGNDAGSGANDGMAAPRYTICRNPPHSTIGSSQLTTISDRAIT
jgi:hypothetical protein